MLWPHLTYLTLLHLPFYNTSSPYLTCPPKSSAHLVSPHDFLQMHVPGFVNLDLIASQMTIPTDPHSRHFTSPLWPQSHILPPHCQTSLTTKPTDYKSFHHLTQHKLPWTSPHLTLISLTVPPLAYSRYLSLTQPYLTSSNRSHLWLPNKTWPPISLTLPTLTYNLPPNLTYNLRT